MTETIPARATDRTFDLPRRLKRETAALHRAVEEATGLPDSVASRADYIGLLADTLAFHSEVMAALTNRRWIHRWSELGIDTAAHDRRPALRADLTELGATVSEDDGMADDAGQLALDTFGEALGCLYVAEGSSLGGRVLGPAIRERIGSVPTRFFDGDDHGHPIPWRATQAALRTYELVGEDPELVLSGAAATFEAYRGIVNA